MTMITHGLSPSHVKALLLITDIERPRRRGTKHFTADADRRPLLTVQAVLDELQRSGTILLEHSDEQERV